MNFAGLSTAAVLAAAAAAALAVLAIYLLRPTPRLQQVSNVDFWKRAVQRARARLLFSTRLPIVALLVTLSIALLLVVELGDPRFGRGFQGTTVVVLDADRSMGALEPGGGAGRTRIARALEWLRELGQQDTVSGRVAVVRAGIRPRVLVPLTTRATDIDRAVRDLALDDGVADLRAAIALAERVIEHSGQGGRIVVLADHAVPRDDATTTTTAAAAARARPRVPIYFGLVGAPAETVGITAFNVRRDPGALGEYSVYTEVRAFTTRPARAHLVIRDRNIVISEEWLALPPGTPVVHHASGFSSAQGEIVARLEDISIGGGVRDALAADDTAYAAVEPLVATRVLLVTPGGNRYLEQVLAANPAVELERTDLAGLTARMNTRGGVARFDVVVLDRVAPPAPLDHPAQVLFAPPASYAPVPTGNALHNPRVTAFATDHRVLAGLRFDQVHVRLAYPIAPAADDRVLVRSERNALAIARERRGARLLAIGFELAATDLPRSVAFPLLMHNAITWLARRETAYQSSQRPGEPIRVPGANATVLLPGGRGADAFGGTFYATERAGIYHARERAVAVSAVDDAGPLVFAGRGRAPDRGGALWPRLAMLVAIALLAVMSVEWILVQRGKLP